MSAVPMRSLTSLGMNMVDSLDCGQSANGLKTKLQQQIFNRVRNTQKQFIRIKQEREFSRGLNIFLVSWKLRKG